MIIGAGSRGITANGCLHLRGNIVCIIPVPAIIPPTLWPLPRNYRGYHGVPAVPITTQLSNANGIEGVFDEVPCGMSSFKGDCAASSDIHTGPNDY